MDPPAPSPNQCHLSPGMDDAFFILAASTEGMFPVLQLPNLMTSKEGTPSSFRRVVPFQKLWRGVGDVTCCEGKSEGREGAHVGDDLGASNYQPLRRGEEVRLRRLQIFLPRLENCIEHHSQEMSLSLITPPPQGFPADSIPQVESIWLPFCHHALISPSATLPCMQNSLSS